ncbi:large conductance mechanosensitive channel protein MscL [Kribbella sp.]|uniref:large conductance mechanosensitive channel protein MscL n=1 Tax=Kribbella sp. TaxID=1871183 RepID=UPI002D65969F|nr:large conductance mechanosensitive channel protein MscL [Kribbella sp.]HZX03948.1 large conductance mechanosensitive channel protein MscL [Kribbella sp.]
MLKGFKEFIMRGNVVDLAVAVVIGAAFGTIVTAVVNNFINPLVAAIFGKADASKLFFFKVNGAEFHIGMIVQAALNFLFVAAAVYFFIVLPLNKLNERRKRGLEPEVEAEAMTPDQELLTEIRDLLRARQVDR